MTRMNFRWVGGILLGLGWIVGAEPAFAWGPSVHYHLGLQVLQMGLLGGGIASLLREHRPSFLFGNVAADVVLGKNMLQNEEHTHHWDVARQVRENAREPAEKAFCAGYWMHLAADTVAHNLYIPDKIAGSRAPKNLSHAYWEFRAENAIPREHREELDVLLEHEFELERDLVERSLRATVLPHPMNWGLLKQVLKLSSHRLWHQFGQYYARISRRELNQQEIEQLFQLCRNRMTEVVQRKKGPCRVKALNPISSQSRFLHHEEETTPGRGSNGTAS